MTKKIMIIDDEESICVLLKKLFEQEGYLVATEIDSTKAIGVVKKEKPDCVLLDIKMPRVDGLDVLGKIREADKNIKVIMITAYGNIENAMESMRIGAVDYITKPFDLDFVKTLVKKSLEQK